jgi:hypothetical protein
MIQIRAASSAQATEAFEKRRTQMIYLRRTDPTTSPL